MGVRIDGAMFQWVMEVGGVLEKSESSFQWVFSCGGARGRRGTSCFNEARPAWGGTPSSHQFTTDHRPTHKANQADPAHHLPSDPPIQLTQRPIVPLEHVNTHWIDCRFMTGPDDN